VPSSGMGPITKQLQARFLGITNGSQADTFGWLTPAFV